MKTNGSSKRTNEAGSIPALHPYAGSHFPAAVACASCGGSARHGLKEPPADEYEEVLADEAGRLVEHAQREIWDGHAIDAAGMLRDAARLLDLLEQRRRARNAAQDAALSRRKAARS